MSNINRNFYSLPVGLPEDIARLEQAGYYKEAIDLIDLRLAEDWGCRQNSRSYQNLAPSGQKIAPNPMATLPQAMRESMMVHRQMLSGLARSYCYTKEDAFAVLQSKISDFTREEFQSLFDENRLDWRFVNGVPQISHSFYDSLIDTDAGYANRAGTPHDGKRNAQKDAAIATMQAQGSMQLRYTLRATLKASEEVFATALASAKKQGKETVTVRAWLPFPAACDAQSDIVLLDARPTAYTCVAPENAPARSVYWEIETAENTDFALEYAYTQTARYVKLPEPSNGTHDAYLRNEAGASKDMSMFAEYLAEQAPHGQFTPYLRAIVTELTENITAPLERARAIYDYITLNVHYRYMPPYFMLENIAENCALSRRGDCGVMAICFITMCRIAGIPAHWESGLMVSPDAVGCHDWARFYIAPYGWLYADCSYGSSAAREEAEARRTHYFGNLDPYRMVANHTFFAPLTPEKQGWRADPCDNQCGEIELDGVGLMGKDLETDVIVISAE